MNLEKQLGKLKAKAAKIEARIARSRTTNLRRLPKIAGFASVSELIAALQDVQGASKGGKRTRRGGKRVKLDPEAKKKLIAEALKEGSDKNALAKKYGANVNSLRVWVAAAKKG